MNNLFDYLPAVAVFCVVIGFVLYGLSPSEKKPVKQPEHNGSRSGDQAPKYGYVDASGYIWVIGDKKRYTLSEARMAGIEVMVKPGDEKRIKR